MDGGKIPPVHVITFGSPCQNLSLIGNRSGLAGAKSSLFYQAFRIIQEMRDAIDIPEHIQNYFDYEAYGRDVRINEGGVFAPGGYVSAVPEGFKEYYHGPQDIPPEHRIFAYPEKAEPVHSILAALKRFQEAPPAPKKDKAGPSHEER